MSVRPKSVSARGEIATGDRFGFGKNWKRFSPNIDETRIRAAESSLQEMLGVQSLVGATFLDAGCGSGLFSLAAHRLGANVHSFDYDPDSVECTSMLREKFGSQIQDWKVECGSVLDQSYMSSLGMFDYVYSWGVLHHTGQMWQGLSNLKDLVQPRGALFIALYNDQGAMSRYWKFVKHAYNRDLLSRGIITMIHAPYLVAGRYLARLVSNRAKLSRGMSLWYDMRDWLGGYPFEVASPEAVLKVARSYGFELENLKTSRGRFGCNEYVFRRHD